MRQLRSRIVQDSPSQPPISKSIPNKAPKLESLSWMGVRSIIRRRFKRQRPARMHRVNKRISVRRMGECLQDEELLCIICLEQLLVPTTLTCGHAFCLRCIHRQSDTSSALRCALCRLPDDSDFHEPDHCLESMVAVKLGQAGKETIMAYQRREEDPQHVQRRVRRVLQVGEEVRVRKARAREFWRVGKVLEVISKGGEHFYRVEMSQTNERVVLPSRTVNMTHTEVSPYSVFPYFYAAPTFAERMPNPEAQPYNMDELVWEVSYYPPQTNNIWMDYVDNMFMENESVQYLGRSVPSPHPEIIEID